ncbi:unnamed protein product [Schistosoma turkestanicum]|nr:unnamed protein product [Schistosoma turkestanicum]
MLFNNNSLLNHKSFFQIAYDEMQNQKFDYLEEVGATPKLVQAYLTACKSYTSIECISNEFSVCQSDSQFLETFCHLLEVNALDSHHHKNSINTFWIQPWNNTTCDSTTAVNMELITTTIEDHLYQVLLNVDQFSIDDSSQSYIPISLGVRNKLESLCLKQLYDCIGLLDDTMDTTRNMHPAKQSKHTKPSLSNDKTSSFNAVHQLFTKVHILQEGICLLGNLLHKSILKLNSELNSKQKNYQDLLKTLVSHKLMELLPESCRKYIQSIFEAVNSAGSSETEVNSDLFCAFIPDCLADMPNLDIGLDSNLRPMESDDLNFLGLGFWANSEVYPNAGSFRPQLSRGGSPFRVVGDVDMRSLAGQHQFPSTSFPHMSLPQSHVTGGHGHFAGQSLQAFTRENPLACDLRVVRHLFDHTESN